MKTLYFTLIVLLLALSSCSDRRTVELEDGKIISTSMYPATHLQVGDTVVLKQFSSDFYPHFYGNYKGSIPKTYYGDFNKKNGDTVHYAVYFYRGIIIE